MRHADWVEKRIQRNAAGQFVKKIDFINGDDHEIQHAIFLEENSDAARTAEDDREIKRRETERSNELELLGSAKDLREFRQAREQGRIEKEPEPTSDMTYEEYREARRASH